jgi:hypothetical protein
MPLVDARAIDRRAYRRSINCTELGGIKQNKIEYMTRFYQPDLSENIDSPLVRDGNTKLVRRSYWLDMIDRTLVVVMTNGIGAHLTNDEKRAHLTDLRRWHLIDQICIQEILPPER